MAKRKDAVTLSELRASPARVMKRARGSQRPLVVTERGRPSAILMSIGTYDALQDERDIRRIVRRGQRQADAGRFFTLADVRADFEKVLKRQRK